MELLLELIFELLIEGSAEIAKDKKVNKWIRYPLAVLLLLFILAIIIALAVIGIIFLTEEKTNTKLFGILFIIIDVILIISAIKKICKIKQTETEKTE